MKITEIMSSLKLFQATVRLQASSRSPISTTKTAIYAENALQATELLTRQFGERSLLSIAIYEDGENDNVLTTEGTQTLTADQLRIKSLSDQKALIAKREKSERSRQKIVKAQAALQKANAARLTVGR